MAKASNLQGGGVSNRSEGGWGIVVVLAAHVAMASTGILRCAGVLYLPWMNEFDTSAKETATVQSLMASTAGFSVLVGGVLCNRIGCRLTGMLGGFLIWLGLFCSSWANSIVHLYATAAIFGIGLGILLNAANVVVTLYFARRYNLANAVVYAGRGTGTIAIPPLFQLLLDSYGWRGACLVTSALMANMILCGALFRPRRVGRLARTSTESATHSQEEPRQGSRREKSDHSQHRDNCTDERTSENTDEPDCLTALPMGDVIASSDDDNTEHDRCARRVAKLLQRLSDEIGLVLLRRSFRFALLCVIQFLFSLSYVVFPMFVIPRAESIGVAPSSAASLMSILGVGSLIGSLGNAPMIGWRVSAEHVTAICAGLTGIAPLLATADGYGYLAVASFIYGFTTGAIFAITFVLCRSYVGVKHFALSIGWGFICNGIGFLLGPIISGWILDATRSYAVVFYMSAGVQVTCAFLCLLLPRLKRIEPGFGTPNVADE